MPWNGRRDVLIDRFDARAVLDMVPLSPKVGHALRCDCRGRRQFQGSPNVCSPPQRLHKADGPPTLIQRPPHSYNEIIFVETPPIPATSLKQYQL